MLRVRIQISKSSKITVTFFFLHCSNFWPLNYWCFFTFTLLLTPVYLRILQQQQQKITNEFLWIGFEIRINMMKYSLKFRMPSGWKYLLLFISTMWWTKTNNNPPFIFSLWHCYFKWLMIAYDKFCENLNAVTIGKGYAPVRTKDDTATLLRWLHFVELMLRPG